jgi:general secretion pathway protein C
MRLNRFALTPYRTRQLLDAATALVIVSIAFALAGFTWRLAGHAGTGAITVPATKPALPVADTAPMIALAPFGRASLDGEGATPTGLQMVLKGLVFARPATLSVAYIAAGAEVPKPFKVGDAVQGAMIEAIQPQRVLLRNAGRVEFLAFPDPAATATPAGTAPSTPGPVANAATVVPPPPANAAAELLQRLNAQPVNGGYRIGDSPPPGLQSGDVVQSVNGTPLTNPDAARAAFAGAQSSGTAQIVIQRGGRPVTLTLPVR